MSRRRAELKGLAEGQLKDAQHLSQTTPVNALREGPKRDRGQVSDEEGGQGDLAENGSGNIDHARFTPRVVINFRAIGMLQPMIGGRPGEWP